MVHFDVPTAAGRQIFSIRCCDRNQGSSLRGSSLAVARSDSGPVIAVFVNRDGNYFTDYAISDINMIMLKVLVSLSM
jgi:hypothetical protein